jgi:hypothetical protein
MWRALLAEERAIRAIKSQMEAAAEPSDIIEP